MHGTLSRDQALKAYDCAINSNNPDWQSIAAGLRAALASDPSAAIKVAPKKRRRTGKAGGAAAVADYSVEKAAWKRLQWPSPVLSVTFADGTNVQCPAVSLKGKPVNVARGLRLACAFYHSRKKMTAPPVISVECESGTGHFTIDQANAAIEQVRIMPPERDYSYRSLYDPRDYYLRLRRNLPLNCPAKSAWRIAQQTKG